MHRISLNAFAIVRSRSPGAKKVFELFTLDISSRGAFFPMMLPLPTGERVSVTLYLSISPVERIPDFPRRARITTRGQVVRSTPQGMAVEFDKHYTISPVAV